VLISKLCSKRSVWREDGVNFRSNDVAYKPASCSSMSGMYF
jgi:hypothetical protein